MRERVHIQGISKASDHRQYYHRYKGGSPRESLVRSVYPCKEDRFLRRLNGYSSSFFVLGFFSSCTGWRRHFKGIFWLVPSATDRRMLIGRTPSSSSSRATSIGGSSSCFQSLRAGAAID